MIMAQFWMKKLVKPALLGGAMLSLGACAYDGSSYGGGSYGDGYVNRAGYGCDPYAPFDDYYACDDGYGYANIGFGGGWYDSFYYPGYGTYIFDRRGSRYAMQRNHRRHWARQRAEFGSRHARRGWTGGDRRAERRRDLTPAQRAERRDRRAERRRDLTPEQRAERRAERRRDLTPAQRAERRERRAERRDRRATNGDRTTGAPTGRAALRDGAIRGKRGGEARQTRRANRQGNSARSERRARPAATQQRGQQARPVVRQKSVPAARTAPRPVTKARPTRRSSRGEISRRDVNID